MPLETTEELPEVMEVILPRAAVTQEGSKEVIPLGLATEGTRHKDMEATLLRGTEDILLSSPRLYSSSRGVLVGAE